MHLPRHRALPANHHLDFGFGQRHGDGSCISGGIDRQTFIFDVISRWKAICLLVLLCGSFLLISVSNLWDMIIQLWMCKGPTHHATVLESKSGGKMANTLDFYLQVTNKWQSKIYISNEIWQQNISEWCPTCHRKSGECSWHICLNYHCCAALIHVSKCITLCTDLEHMVQIFEIAYGMSSKLRRRSWIWKGEEVELYLPKTGEMIYMP